MAAGMIVSYDFWKLTPYVSGRISTTQYENPTGYHWRMDIYESTSKDNKIAFLPAVGIDIRLTNETIITLEAGIVRNYYKRDNLYVSGFSLTF